MSTYFSTTHETSESAAAHGAGDEIGRSTDQGEASVQVGASYFETIMRVRQGRHARGLRRMQIR